MVVTAWLFDGLLAASLIWLAWQLLATANLFKAIVLFIVFGLLTALSYGRMQALDVALTEAAVGAGITGALFLNALGRMRTREMTGTTTDGDDNGGVNEAKSH